MVNSQAPSRRHSGIGEVTAHDSYLLGLDFPEALYIKCILRMNCMILIFCAFYAILHDVCRSFARQGMKEAARTKLQGRYYFGQGTRPFTMPEVELFWSIFLLYRVVISFSYFSPQVRDVSGETMVQIST